MLGYHTDPHVAFSWDYMKGGKCPRHEIKSSRGARTGNLRGGISGAMNLPHKGELVM